MEVVYQRCTPSYKGYIIPLAHFFDACMHSQQVLIAVHMTLSYTPLLPEM